MTTDPEVQVIDMGEFRLFMSRGVTVDGIRSRHCGGEIRRMFDLLPLDAIGPAFRWRPDITVDETRYLTTGRIHALNCRCDLDFGYCRG